MHPYEHKKLEEYPDVADIQEEARRSRVGRLPTKSGQYKSYTRNSRSKRAVRRSLKRADKAKLKLD